MPYQGNPNAGALDPNLMSLLFQRQRDRAELQVAQQKAQMEAILKAKEDERAQKKFDLEMAIKNQELMQGRAKTAADIQTLMGSVGERAQAVDPAQRQAAQTSQFFTSVGDGDPQLGQDFAAAVVPNDPNVFNEELALASTLTGDRLLDQDVDAAAQMRGVSRADVLGGAQTQLNMAEIGRGRERAEWDRQFGMQEQKEIAAREDQQRFTAAENKLQEDRLRKRPLEQVRMREKRLQKLANQIEGNALQGDDLELAKAEYAAIKAERDADLSRGQDASVVTEQRRRADDNFEYDLVYDQNWEVSELLNRVRSGDTTGVGVEGFAAQFLGNFVDVVSTASQIPFVDRYAASFDAVVNNPANSDEDVERIRREFFSPEVLQRVADNQITESEARWWLMYSLNPDGRVSNLLSKETQALTDFVGPTIGPELAQARLTAIEKRQQRFLRRKQSYIKQTNPLEAFDPTDGRRIASESVPKSKPVAAAPTTTRTPRLKGDTRKRMTEDLLNAP